MTLISMLVFNFAYPQSKTVYVKDTIFGVEISDPYRWLENVEDPEVKDWIAKQNDLALTTLKSLPGYRKLHREIKRDSRRKNVSLPSFRRGRYFYYKYDGKSDHSVLYMTEKKWNYRRNKKILDPNRFSKDGLVSLDFAYLSLDGKYAAFGKSYGGSENSTLYILDIDHRRLLSDTIPDTKWTSVAWLPDNSGFYYARNTGGKRFLPRIYFHKIGTTYVSDQYVFGEGLPETWMPSINISKDGRFLVLSVEKGWTQNDLYIRKTEDKGDWVKIAENLDGTFSLRVYQDNFYILTNYKAPNYRLLRVSVSDPNIDRAQEIIPEKGWILEDFDFAGGKLVFAVTESTFSRIFVADLEGNVEYEIPLPVKGTAYFSVEDHESPIIYIGFQSFLYPPSIFSYDVNTRKMKKIWQEKVHFKPEKFTQEFVLYPSKDGTNIPMYILRKIDTKLDGTNPTILTGYGGFGAGMKPYFMGENAFFRRNFVYAVACLRGGNEFGEEWHRQGMRDKKQNVFDDFISAAEYLINRGYTNPEKLAISGGSNGGLLVGAVMVQRPDLFKAVYCGVLLLDMIRFHRFGVAHIWIPEYGNPDDPEDFKYLFAYSPYHRIDTATDKIMPSVFFHTAEFDGRVHPMHAMKMAAKMQNMFKSKGPVLLYVEPKAGHGAGMPRKKRIENSTLRTIYLLWQLGVRI